MTTSRSPLRFLSRPRQSATTESTDTINQLRSAAPFLEDLIPGAETEREKKPCREIVQRYRTAARNLARRACCDDQGQDIAEYAVIFPVPFFFSLRRTLLVANSSSGRGIKLSTAGPSLTILLAVTRAAANLPWPTSRLKRATRSWDIPLR